MIVIVAEACSSDPSSSPYLIDTDKLADGPYKEAIMRAINDKYNMAELVTEEATSYGNKLGDALIEVPFTGTISHSVVLYVE